MKVFRLAILGTLVLEIGLGDVKDEPDEPREQFEPRMIADMPQPMVAWGDPAEAQLGFARKGDRIHDDQTRER